MKNILSALLLASGLMLSAQVGINTDSPKAKLDVNGDMNMRDKIAVLDATDNSLSQGNNDQLLVSQGVGYAPIWKTLRIPEYEPNKFYLIFNNSFSDKAGVEFVTSEQPNMTTSKAATFTKGADITSLKGFKKIDGLSQTISVFSTESKAYFQFETVVQANFGANGNPDTSIDYACGIFVDNKLINMRQRNLRAINSQYPFLTHNQIGIVQNLSKGNHTVSVACSRLASYGDTSKKLAIGKNTSTNINDFVAQSSLKVDVYEVPQVFNPIIN
ncbi:hypothetical protein C1637_03715 [Chryseobacterium lactis]|uniref:Uncharacterized protein n=1 Tax=Chryseobacterium lactis TaxID=1241981 RepID=A0A3G6RP82_CHRLC|nr:hypothetical protein [Chryseobacterium lactis]AZA81694.1 hypothetical protein EG342_07110 [Chryseobacterium lactis]AZB06692.1 hypothetical protein EG341_23230 [Chryseobacterium lactis]PNW15543.1 hypothetical protein C1637_03715 [Chryseobacterium lactis]